MEPSTFETSLLKEAVVSVAEAGTFVGLGGYKKVVDMAISLAHENRIAKRKIIMITATLSKNDTAQLLPVFLSRSTKRRFIILP